MLSESICPIDTVTYLQCSKSISGAIYEVEHLLIHIDTLVEHSGMVWWQLCILRWLNLVGVGQGRIKLLPVTHVLVDTWMLTVKPVYKLLNVSDDLKWTTNTYVTLFSPTFKA